MISGYLTPVESDSFGCLLTGGYVGTVGHYLTYRDGGLVNGGQGIGYGMVSFLHYYMMNYQRL